MIAQFERSRPGHSRHVDMALSGLSVFEAAEKCTCADELPYTHIV